MRKIIIFLLVFCSVVVNNHCIAGNEIDSLKSLLSETHNAARKIELNTILSKRYLRIDITEASRYAHEAKKLSDQTGNEIYSRDINGILGDIAVMQDSLELARNYYKSNLKIAEEQENIADLISFSHVLGNIAFVQDDLLEALKFYHQAVKYVEESGQDDRLDDLFMNIGAINFRMRNIPVAQDYLIKALEGFVNSGDSVYMAGTLANIALTYSYLENYNLAEQYFQQSLDIYLLLNVSVEIAETYSNMASAEYQKENYRKAIDLLNLSIEYLNKKNIHYKGPKQTLLSIIYERLGANYLKLNDLEQAYACYLKGYALAVQHRKVETISEAAKGLSDFWYIRGDTDSAYYYLNIHKIYSDTVNNAERVKEQTYQSARFEFDQLIAAEQMEQERKAEIQKRNRLLYIFIIAVLFMLLVLTLLLLKLGRNKVKRVELEQKTLRHELELREKELELRNKELTTHVLYQVKNNEFTLDLVEKLKGTLTDKNKDNKSQINAVIKEIERESSHETWKEFELRFQNVYTDFYKKLSQDFPDLTANELRICAFLKLNMSTKDIAAITYQTDSSIRVARWRLRQKFGLEKEDNLVSFLARF